MSRSERPNTVALPYVPYAASVAEREVAAHPVIGDPVGVGTGAHGDASAGAAQAPVEDHLVVVDADIVVIAVRVDQAVIDLGREERMADPDAASVETAVVGNPVVGDLQIVGITVHDDAAARVGALDGKAVDPGTLVGCCIESPVPGSHGKHDDTCSLFIPEGDRLGISGAYFLPGQQVNRA